MRNRLALGLLGVSLSAVGLGLGGAGATQAAPMPHSVTARECWEGGGTVISHPSASSYCKGGVYDGRYVR